MSLQLNRFDTSKWFKPSYFLNVEVARENERAKLLTEVDFRRVEFKDFLADGEQRILHREQMDRYEQSGLLGLDARVAQALWEEPFHNILDWVKNRKVVSYLDFPGTVFKLEYVEPDDSEKTNPPHKHDFATACLFFSVISNQWEPGYLLFEGHVYRGRSSTAVLA